MIDERRLHLDNEPDQRAMRTARGLRALAAALMVAGLVAAILTELPFSRSSVAATRASEEIANPLPATDPTGVAVPGSPDDFQDRTPTPPSVIVG